MYLEAVDGGERLEKGAEPSAEGVPSKAPRQ
jgi:hypothetical protein